MSAPEASPRAVPHHFCDLCAFIASPAALAAITFAILAIAAL